MVSKEARYQKNPDFVFRQIAEETILVPIRRSAADLECLYALDGVGPRVWELIDGQRTAGEIVAAIVEEYDVETATAEADVAAFLSDLASLGAVERVS